MGKVSYLFLQNETALRGLYFIVCHGVDLLVQELNLLFIKNAVLLIINVESFGSEGEEIFHNVEGIVKPGLEDLKHEAKYLHLFFGNLEHFF